MGGGWCGRHGAAHGEPGVGGFDERAVAVVGERAGEAQGAVERAAVGRHEPDVGELNYEYLFRLLDELKYDGWVGCEYKPSAGTAAGLTWLYKLLDRRKALA